MKSIYESGLHHPLAAYCAGLLLLGLLARKLGFLPGFLILFTAEILADATVTGAWSPLPADSVSYQRLSIGFVILGDLRYFILAEHYTRPNVPLGRILLVAIPISLIVPLISGLGSRVLPAMEAPRVLYLVYEVMLLCLVLGLQLLVYRRRHITHADAKFVRRLSAFVVLQYAGWALADVVILSGNEIGHLLRIVPNLMYYAAFLPFVYAVAPPAEIHEAEQ